MLPQINVDPLTGLPNAIYAMDALRRLIRLHSPLLESEVAVGVVFLDIFRLKTPHDNYGHQPVDDVLCAIARAPYSTAREGEIFCRYGGDEFLLIVPNVTDSEIRQRAEEVRDKVQQLQIVVNGEPREHLVFSVGAARYSGYDANYPHSSLRGPEALMRSADADLMRDRQRNVERAANSGA